MCEKRAGRFGPNPLPRTVRKIEEVVEWVEAQTKPFTNRDAWNAVGGGPSGWRTTYLTLLDLRDHGLIKRANSPLSKPGLWIRADIHQED